MAEWDSKFIGGHIEINNEAGSMVTAYSTTDNDKRSFCNAGGKVVEAYWQGREVVVKMDYGGIFRYYSDCNCH